MAQRNPIVRLIEAASLLEDWMSATANGEGGHAWTITNTDSLWSDMESYVTASSGALSTAGSEPSQVTIRGDEALQYAGSVPSYRDEETDLTPPKYGSLEQDAEAKETKKAFLDRRRKQCEPDEVDVALAPVLKIPVSYCFYPEQYRAFRKLFPRVTPDSGLSYTHHDHPVAHTATLVGIRAMQNMLRPGEKVLDIHGNPNGNEAFNRFQESRIRKRQHLPKPPKIETMVEMRTSQDAVRMITKWGDPFTDDGTPRYIRGNMDDIPKAKYDTFLSVHTLYYYGMYGVCKLLSNNPGARMLALVNYSKDQMGTLYNELKFSKTDGVTTQTSPNGEKYVHPDIDHWFQTSNFCPNFSSDLLGISWTSTNLGGPLYLLTITACDPQLAKYSSYKMCEAPTLKVMGDKHFFGLIRFRGTEVRLKISNVELASELRHFMTFRDRNPQTFLDLCVKARRCTGKDLIEGSRQFTVNDGELQDHIVYAYLVDAPGELEVMDGVQLLKGDLLDPLSSAVKMEGSGKSFKWSEWFFGRVDVNKKAMGSSAGPATLAGHKPKLANTGGLIPRNRA